MVASREHGGTRKNSPMIAEPVQGRAGIKWRTIRNIIWMMVLSIAIGLIGWRMFNPQQPPPTAKQLGQALVRSDFRLIDHLGQKVVAENYFGKWQLVFFGYTFCPDVCPTTLSIISQAMEILGEGADKVVPLFISVDPDRDTPEVLAKYVQAFGSRMVGLTGTPEQVSAAAQAFRIFYSKVPQKGLPDGYLMGHSGVIYLMTPDGTYEASFSHERDTSETIAAAIKMRLKNP